MVDRPGITQSQGGPCETAEEQRLRGRGAFPVAAGMAAPPPTRLPQPATATPGSASAALPDLWPAVVLGEVREAQCGEA